MAARFFIAGTALGFMTTVVPAASPAPPPGAASCSGCHSASAAVGATVPPRLDGRDPTEIVGALQAFKSGQRAATVMDRIAKGFSDAEIQAIAAWYADRH